MEKECRIKHFPVSFFSVILGLAGLTIAFQRAEQVLKVPIQISGFLLIFTSLVFIAISAIYLFKLTRFGAEVRQEFNHPIKLSFFPTFSVSLLLLSIALLPVNMPVSQYLWVAGAIIHLVFTVKIVSIWIRHNKFEIKHLNPSWFIPAVGNILVPVAGVSHYPAEISWFFLSIGLFFWLALFNILLYRIIFHNPLPDKLLPTLFILIAPPAAGFISLVKLSGEVTDFAKLLYYFGLFIALLLLGQINLFRKIRFYLSWWAYSFPVAALTIASILMFHETGSAIFAYFSWALLAILLVVIVLLIAKTVMAIARREICVEED